MSQGIKCSFRLPESVVEELDRHVISKNKKGSFVAYCIMETISALDGGTRDMGVQERISEKLRNLDVRVGELAHIIKSSQRGGQD